MPLRMRRHNGGMSTIRRLPVAVLAVLLAASFLTFGGMLTETAIAVDGPCGPNPCPPPAPPDGACGPNPCPAPGTLPDGPCGPNPCPPPASSPEGACGRNPCPPAAPPTGACGRSACPAPAPVDTCAVNSCSPSAPGTADTKAATAAPSPNPAAPGAEASPAPEESAPGADEPAAPDAAEAPEDSGNSTRQTGSRTPLLVLAGLVALAAVGGFGLYRFRRSGSRGSG